MSETIAVARVIPTRAERIFNAWLDPVEHGKMTTDSDSARSLENGAFTAWDGYISGKTLSSEPNTRIVQSWRTTDFPQGAEDSTITISFDEVEGGTRVTIVQEHIPEGTEAEYQKGWDDYYFDPMTKYFATAGSRLKEMEEVIEGAVEKTEAAVEQALEDAGVQMKATAKEAKVAVNKAQARAGKQVAKAVKAVKKVQKKAVARAKSVGASVKKLLSRKPSSAKKPAAKPVKKAAPVRKAVKKLVARKPAPAPKRAAAPKKKKAAARPASKRR
jgi:uncharacterized protein YndB with AHSA1/START domain